MQGMPTAGIAGGISRRGALGPDTLKTGSIQMTDVPTDQIAARLEEAAAAIERSLRRARQGLGSAAAGMSDESRSALEREWSALKSDLADLMDRGDIAESPEVQAALARIRGTMSRVSDTISNVRDGAQQRAREGADRVADFAHASPWQAAGIAAVAGFVIGVLLSRK
jgi:ElaB/YqjD/DUF883 family membrane-anchored ribosome-binding protein